MFLIIICFQSYHEKYKIIAKINCKYCNIYDSNRQAIVFFELLMSLEISEDQSKM